jgi:hypothetical protein
MQRHNNQAEILGDFAPQGKFDDGRTFQEDMNSSQQDDAISSHQVDANNLHHEDDYFTNN